MPIVLPLTGEGDFQAAPRASAALPQTVGERLGFDADDTEARQVNSTGRRNTSMMRCCNAETETEKVRPGGSACDAFAWSAAGNGACGAATVLEGDRAGAVE